LLNKLPNEPVTYFDSFIASKCHHSVHSSIVNKSSINGGVFHSGSVSKSISLSAYVCCNAVSKIDSSSGDNHQINTDINQISSIIFHLRRSQFSYSLSSNFGGRSNGFMY
jgi:hypothetical protein